MTVARILVVNDDPSVLKRIRQLLLFERIEIQTSNSAFEALDLLTRQSFQVVLTDQQMPYIQGTELVQKAQEMASSTVFILMSEEPGIEMVAAEADEKNPGTVRFIRKPFQEDELMLVLRQALAHAEYRNRKAEVGGLQSELTEISNLTENNIEWLHEIYQLKLEVRNSQMDSLRILSSLIELQNKPLWEHSRRVALLTRKMAEVLDIPREQRVQLEVASLFHDLGSLGAEKKTCPVIGAAIISMIPEYVEAATAIRFHHEHFDGNGYPDGLIGLQIPLLARIIATADVCEKLLREKQLDLKTASPALIRHEIQSLPGRLDPNMIIVLEEVLKREQRRLEPGSTSRVLSDLYRNKTGPLVENVQNLDLPHLRTLGIAPKTTEERRVIQSAPARQVSQACSAYRQAARGTGTHGTPPVSSQGEPPITHTLKMEQSIDHYRQTSQNMPSNRGYKDMGSNESSVGLPVREPSFRHDVKRFGINRNIEDLNWSDVMQQIRERRKHESEESPANSGHVIDMTRYRKNGKLPDELRIDEMDLCPGMVLSRDLVTGRGVMILHRNSLIQEEYIPKLSALLEKDPPRDGIYIYNFRYV